MAQLKCARPCTDSHRIPYERAKVGNSSILPSLTRQTTLDSLEIAASAENVPLKLVAVTENHPNPRTSSAHRPHFRSLLKPLYRKPRMISNALLFFSGSFEQISFFVQKTSGYCSSVGHLPAIKPTPPTLPQLAPWRPPPTQRLGAVVGALKNRLRRRHALVIDNASCTWRFLTLRDSGLVGYSLDACRDNCRKW